MQTEGRCLTIMSEIKGRTLSFSLDFSTLNVSDDGDDLSSVITKPRAKSIQSPDTFSGLNDVNLWPDTTAASGFWLPTMPTDYDSLDEGENEIPRGRLF